MFQSRELYGCDKSHGVGLASHTDSERVPAHGFIYIVVVNDVLLVKLGPLRLSQLSPANVYASHARRKDATHVHVRRYGHETARERAPRARSSSARRAGGARLLSRDVDRHLAGGVRLCAQTGPHELVVESYSSRRDLQDTQESIDRRC